MRVCYFEKKCHIAAIHIYKLTNLLIVEQVKNANKSKSTIKRCEYKHMVMDENLNAINLV